MPQHLRRTWIFKVVSLYQIYRHHSGVSIFILAGFRENDCRTVVEVFDGFRTKASVSSTQMTNKAGRQLFLSDAPLRVFAARPIWRRLCASKPVVRLVFFLFRGETQQRTMSRIYCPFWMCFPWLLEIMVKLQCFGDWLPFFFMMVSWSFQHWSRKTSCKTCMD